MLGAKGKNTNKKPGGLSKVKGEKAVLKGLKGYCGFSASSSSSYSSTWRHHCYIINHLCLKLTVWSQTLLLWFSKITHTWFIASPKLPPLAHSPLTIGLFSTMIDFLPVLHGWGSGHMTQQYDIWVFMKTEEAENCFHFPFISQNFTFLESGS